MHLEFGQLSLTANSFNIVVWTINDIQLLIYNSILVQSTPISMFRLMRKKIMYYVPIIT